jgi:hypothetical protein
MKTIYSKQHRLRDAKTELYGDVRLSRSDHRRGVESIKRRS